jgi:murein DD-endopeptidase MepM/ murein hydrolase activator NlpD
MVIAGCPRCSSVVAIHEGRPHVNSDGSIELWHVTCWFEREFPQQPAVAPALVETVPPQKPRARARIIRVVPAATCGAVALIGVLEWLGTTPVQTSMNINNENPVVEENVWMRTNAAAKDELPPRIVRVESKLEVRYPIPIVKGVALDETYPTLYQWIHPVTSAPELTTDNPMRAFGAFRGEIHNRPECGADFGGGHCGIDLDGPRGRPVVAVAAGTLIRVEHSENGLDGLSGRYVRIQHDDGTITAYMHLDQIATGLQAGDRVDAGQEIGLLGMTAVKVPHLHFSLEIPNHRGPIGEDTGDTHYADPAPFLVRAQIKVKPERRHTDKPKS